MILLVISATCVPIVVYLLIGFLPNSRAANVKDYFIYNQTVSTSDYANTSVGYALQMAAIFLFAYWGSLYGLGSLWTPAFWAAGFYLLVRLLPRFKDYHRNGTTMHAYLASTFGGSIALQRLAATATMFGLLGTMMAEVDYTIQIYTPFVKTEFWQMILGAGFLVFGLAYIIRNGYKAEVNTERTQIPVAYTALMAVIICLLPAVWTYSGQYPFHIVVGLLGFTFALHIWEVTGRMANSHKDIQFYIPFLAFLAVLAVWRHVHSTAAGNAPSVLSLPLLTQLQAQHKFGLFSLFIANFLWMPVDLSTWQRVASVHGSDESLLSSLRQGTQRVLFESPATWVLGAILGICISAGRLLRCIWRPQQRHHSFSTALSSPDTLSRSVLLPWVLYPLFLIASVTIMLSTVHCMISAVSFTAFKDFAPSRREESLRRARALTIGVMIIGMLLYPYLRFHFYASLPTLLYGAYSFQLSLIVIALEDVPLIVES